MAASPPDAFPFGSTRGRRGVVATADQLASQAGLVALWRGGNAVDAAIAANAAIAVTGPHLCGMGGDLFALVHTGRSVIGLDAAGRAGSGVDAEALRAEGHVEMPFRHDVRTVTVPGCVDGWVTLHERFGQLALAEVLGPAIELAEHGFPASPLLVGACHQLDDRARANLREVADAATRPGAMVTRPGAGRALRSIADRGRDGFYGGEFGAGLIELGGGVFHDADLAASQARWVDPLVADAFGVELHTIGPPSQGYLTLGSAGLAAQLDLPDDPDDPRWAHLLVEATVAAGHDRPAVLHERAAGTQLLDEIAARIRTIDPEHASGLTAPAAVGDTTYLCTADGHGMAVSLIQSNASDFGSWLAEPATGINLHNRGLGFNLVPGHPAEVGPGRRPPHTLSPALATRDGSLAAVFGTMGGDAQAQIHVQLLARLVDAPTDTATAPFSGDVAGTRGTPGGTAGLAHRDLQAAIDAPRWVVDVADGTLAVEADLDDVVVAGLAARGHHIVEVATHDHLAGHAHAIAVGAHGYAAGSDPRCEGAALGC